MGETFGPDLLVLAATLAGGGLITGFLAGLFGIGGGGIAVIVLFELFSYLHVPDAVRMHVSVGTALVVMLFTALRSVNAHRARGAVDFTVVRSMAPWVVAGVAAGSLLARYAPGEALKAVWVVVAPVMAIQMFVGNQRWRLGDTIPGGLFKPAYGAALGFVSTIMSIGGGVFVSTMMTLFGRPIHQAIGTASAFGPVIGLPAIIGFAWAGWAVTDVPAYSVGYVNLPGAALVAAFSMAAAPYGVRVAHSFRRRTLEICFGCFLTFMAGRFLYSIVT